jgi:hypothetical protein
LTKTKCFTPLEEFEQLPGIFSFLSLSALQSIILAVEFLFFALLLMILVDKSSLAKTLSNLKNT